MCKKKVSLLQSVCWVALVSRDQYTTPRPTSAQVVIREMRSQVEPRPRTFPCALFDYNLLCSKVKMQLILH